MNTLRHTLLRAGAIVALLVMVAVPPALVARLIGRPWPAWDVLRAESRNGQFSNDSVMRLAAALFVLVWIWLVASIATQVLAILRSRRLQPKTSRVPIETSGSGRLDRLIRFALLGSVTTAATVSTWSSAAVATSPTLSSLATPLTPPASAPVDPTQSVPSEPSTTTIVSNGRLTPLSVAYDLGDESLRDDIVAMNRSSEWSGGVFPDGMLITVPITHASESQASQVEGVVEYVVQPNDGMWNVAEALLGDGSLHHELRQRLIGQEVAPGVLFDNDTYVIHPGWVFALDNDANVAAPATGHTVLQGESLSSIAESRLGDKDRWPEIWAANAHRTMSDGLAFDDPNLILPGWSLTIPAASDTGTAPDAPLPPPTPPSAADETESTSPSADHTPRDTPGVNAETSPTPATTLGPQPPSTTVADGGEADRPELADAAATPSVTSVPMDTREPADRIDADEASPFSNEARSIWPHIAAGVLLTAGLAETIRRHRRRRMANVPMGERIVAPPAVAAGTELALNQREHGNRLSTLRHLLRQFTPYAREFVEPPPVRAVQLGDNRLEILFTRAAPMPPAGWTTVDGGQSWTHALDDDPPVETSRQLVTPALATIGVRDDEDGDEVLLDLETAARIALVGDRDAALGLARSITLELAAHGLGVPMDVCLVGLHVDGSELCDRVWTNTTIQRAVSVARQMLELHSGAGATSMTSSRAALDDDDGEHDPQVFVIDIASLSLDERELLDDLMPLCQPSTGNVAVLVGDHPEAIERIDLDGERGRWGKVALRPPNVSLEAAAQVAVTLDHAAHAETEPIPVNSTTAEVSKDETKSEPAGGGSHDDTDDSWIVDEGADDVEIDVYEPPPYEVLVKVMGTVEVEAGDRTFSSQDTEMLALFTCLRDRSTITKDLVQTNIGDDISDRTAGNRVSGLRRALGVGPDGTDLLSKASPGRYSNGCMTLSPLVLTDYDLLRHRYEASLDLGSGDALTVLRDGLALMRGPLFRVRTGFRWPGPEGVTSRMQSGVVEYAGRVMELAMEADDIALVLEATSVAAGVIDDPMVELPMRSVEQHYADATGSPELAESVMAAKKRFMDYVNTHDALAES
ncbi:MAG: hypothetical protein ACE37B_07190 [Ilumatobacter sp.]|uniref:LysM peptidoglycan-binding domain-containing protein n=1 Tax=Ilumatobacter sp. TaxID=1967498 RepID=UPI003918A9A4